MFIPVVLSDARVSPGRDEGESKDPGDFSSIHIASGSSHDTRLLLGTIHYGFQEPTVLGSLLTY